MFEDAIILIHHKHSGIVSGITYFCVLDDSWENIKTIYLKTLDILFSRVLGILSSNNKAGAAGAPPYLIGLNNIVTFIVY